MPNKIMPSAPSTNLQTPVTDENRNATSNNAISAGGRHIEIIAPKKYGLMCSPLEVFRARFGIKVNVSAQTGAKEIVSMSAPAVSASMPTAAPAGEAPSVQVAEAPPPVIAVMVQSRNSAEEEIEVTLAAAEPAPIPVPGKTRADASAPRFESDRSWNAEVEAENVGYIAVKTLKPLSLPVIKQRSTIVVKAIKESAKKQASAATSSAVQTPVVNTAPLKIGTNSNDIFMVPSATEMREMDLAFEALIPAKAPPTVAKSGKKFLGSKKLARAFNWNSARSSKANRGKISS